MAKLDCLAVLKAVSEPNRVRILRLLLKEKLGVNEVAHRLELSQYNVSKHLRILRQAGLLEVEKWGKQRFYHIPPLFRTRLAQQGRCLKLDCCTLHFDRLCQ